MYNHKRHIDQPYYTIHQELVSITVILTQPIFNFCSVCKVLSGAVEIILYPCKVDKQKQFYLVIPMHEEQILMLFFCLQFLKWYGSGVLLYLFSSLFLVHSCLPFFACSCAVVLVPVPNSPLCMSYVIEPFNL